MARSQTGAPPSPLSPLLNDIAMMLPFPRKVYHALDDSEVPLSSLDPDTSKLLPTQGRTHHVWVQGRLAPVKSVSIANLRRSRDKAASTVPSAPGTPSTSSRGTSPARSRFSNITTPSRRRSFDDAHFDGVEYKSDSRKEISRRNCQLRGYGIGGAGNIRRPTDVIHGPVRSKDSLTSAKRTSTSSESVDEDKKKNSLRQMFRLPTNRKAKGRAG